MAGLFTGGNGASTGTREKKMKAMVVLDEMPESCSDCEFQYMSSKEICGLELLECEVTGNYIRPEWQRNERLI